MSPTAVTAATLRPEQSVGVSRTAPEPERPSGAPLRPRTLPGRLELVLDEIRDSVGRKLSRKFLRRIRLHVGLALDAARIQADEVEMLRGQAADRERALAVVQRLRGELDRVEGLLPSDGGPLSQYRAGGLWVVSQVRGVLEQGGRPGAARDIEFETEGVSHV